MKNRILHLAVAAAMQSMQAAPQQLKTTGHKIASNVGFNGIGRKRTRNKRFRSRGMSKYQPHQGKQECARRLKRGSAAWYSSGTMAG